MRILIALVVVVAAVVALVLWLPSRGAPTVVEPVAVAPAEPESRAPLDLDAAAPRVEPERTASVEPASAGEAARDTCRVEIVLVWPTDSTSNRADVQLVDAVGRPMPCELWQAMTWLAPALEPGAYHVDVRPRGAGAATGVVFVVAPGERTKRVEVPMRQATTLRVRWQSADGQPIVAALKQPGVLRGPAPIKVVLAITRAQPGDPAPAALMQHSLTHKVQPDADPAQQEERGPPWEGAPADAFGVLVLPSEPPCAVMACIGGLVVESADVLPDTTEVLFRTNVDDVRRWPTTLRFCAVEAESGNAIAGARYMVNAVGGSGYAMVVLGNDGCCVDERVLPGAWTLIVQASDRAPRFLEIELAPGQDLDLGRIALEVGCVARALVKLPDGQPAAGITGLMLPVDRFGSGTLIKSSSGADGIATFTSVPDDEHVLVVVDDRWTSAPVIVPPCGSGASRAQSVVQLVEGVRIALDFGPTSALAPFVLVRNASGLPVARRPIGLTGLVPLRLVPGEYTVEQPDKQGAHAFQVGSESVVIEVR